MQTLIWSSFGPIAARAAIVEYECNQGEQQLLGFLRILYQTYTLLRFTSLMAGITQLVPNYILGLSDSQMN